MIERMVYIVYNKIFIKFYGLIIIWEWVYVLVVVIFVLLWL